MAEVSGRDMARFGQAMGLVFVGLAMFPQVGILAPPAAVATYVAGRNPRRALGIVACAIIAGAVGQLGGFPGAAMALMVSAAGAPIGLGMLRGWSYGRTVAVAVALAISLNAGMMSSQWDETRKWADDRRADIEAAINGPDRKTFEEDGTLPAYEVQVWMFDHFRFVAPGLLFGGYLMGFCLVVSIAARAVFGAGPRPETFGSFRTMRPPDWLAWAVIAVAAMWFADQRWPNETFRMIGWNGAIALSSIYWLNGLGVLIYAAAVLKPHPAIVVVAPVLMVMTNMISVLPVAGLFDTWVGFRNRIDGLAAARASRDASQDGPE